MDESEYNLIIRYLDAARAEIRFIRSDHAGVALANLEIAVREIVNRMRGDTEAKKSS